MDFHDFEHIAEKIPAIGCCISRLAPVRPGFDGIKNGRGVHPDSSSSKPVIAGPDIIDLHREMGVAKRVDPRVRVLG